MSIDEPPDSSRILILQFDWKRGLWKVLVCNGPCESKNSSRPHGCTSGVRGRRIWPAMLHRCAHFHARRKSIEDEPAHFVLENRYQRGVLREIFRGTVDRRGQMSFQTLCHGEHLFRRTALDKEGRRTKEFLA